MVEKRANAFEEFTSTVGRFPNTYIYKGSTQLTERLRNVLHITENEKKIALASFDYIQQQEELAQKFAHANKENPQEIGRGWHGVIYKIGDYVMKINHPQGPVKGFAYPQTPEGVVLAREHLQILKNRAKEYGLPYLVTDDQDIFYVPLSGGEGRLVHVQPFYQQIVTPQEATRIQFTSDEKAMLREEFASFEKLYKTLFREDHLLLDVFGKRNVVLIQEKGNFHFVLIDIEPVDTTIAGPIAEIGMSLAFVKELVKWKVALGVHPRRRLR